MSDHELLEKLRDLTPDRQSLAFEVLQELLISQQISSCSQAITDATNP